MMNHLSELYKKWLNEKNKGHYKNEIYIEKNVLNLFGNQDFIVKEIERVFNFYGIEMKGNILDVGCSMGGLLFSLYKSKKFRFVAGIDIDTTAIEMARCYKKMNNIPDKELIIKIDSVFDISFKDKTFDFIIMKDVAEHLGNEKNLELALKELIRILKDDGYIFIEAPNYLFPIEVHLKIPILPYVSNKRLVKVIAKLFNKEEDFVDHLNFTTPRMFERIFTKLNLNYINAYEDYKIPYILKNHENISRRFNFVKPIVKASNKLSFNRFITYFLKLTKLYPTLWYIVYKEHKR